MCSFKNNIKYRWKCNRLTVNWDDLSWRNTVCITRFCLLVGKSAEECKLCSFVVFLIDLRIHLSPVRSDSFAACYLFVGVSFTAGACLGVVRLEELELEGFLDRICSFLVISFVHGFNQAAISVHVIFFILGIDFRDTDVRCGEKAAHRMSV